jgi:hypothetical protein
MKKTSLFLSTLFVLSVLILSACSGGASASPTGEWTLVSYGDASNPTSALPDVETSINFNEDGRYTKSVYVRYISPVTENRNCLARRNAR